MFEDMVRALFGLESRKEKAYRLAFAEDAVWFAGEVERLAEEAAERQTQEGDAVAKRARSLAFHARIWGESVLRPDFQQRTEAPPIPELVEGKRAVERWLADNPPPRGPALENCAGVDPYSDLAWAWRGNLKRTVKRIVSWWHRKHLKYAWDKNNKLVYTTNYIHIHDYGATPVMGWLDFAVDCADDYPKLLKALSASARPLIAWKFKTINVRENGRFVRVEASWPANLRPKTVKLIGKRTPKPDKIGVGLGTDGREVSISLAWNILAGGETGSGKSVLLRHLVVQASEAGAKLILLDGKGGEGLEDVAECPSMLFPLLVDTEDIAHALAYAWRVCQDRLRLAKKELKKLPWIVVILDEYQDVFQDSKLAADAADKLSRKCRAARMTLILATQNPKETKTFSKANLPTRIGLKVGGVHNSHVIMGDAKEFPCHKLERFEAYCDPPGKRVSLYEPLADLPEGHKPEMDSVPTDWLVADGDQVYVARHSQRRERTDGSLCGKLKIGHSNKPDLRVGGFIEEGWEILYLEPGGEPREKALHRTLDACRCSADKETFWEKGLAAEYLRKNVLDYRTLNEIADGVPVRKSVLKGHGNKRQPTKAEISRYKEMAGASVAALKAEFALPGRRQCGKGFLRTLEKLA